jgi:hypothetical protein
MLRQLTWKGLLKFLLEQREKGLLPEEYDVMMHNVETGDEYPCDILQVDGRLVMAINWDTLD